MNPMSIPKKIQSEKIKYFETHLADFFHRAGRTELPWRKKRITAYEVWVSEIMLQQTQVVRVIGYYRNFLKRFPTVQYLAEATWEEFLPYYQGLGYYARGRNMMKAAQVVVTEYGGAFPRDKKLLESLPGVGPYTASAIMSFAYGENHLAWDTNLKRVIGRFFFGSKNLVTDEEYWENKFVMEKREMNGALMDFGSALCVARPKCEACMLRVKCRYYQENGKSEQKADQAKLKLNDQGSRINWQEARVIVTLHERHQKYFSSKQKEYQPFLLPQGYTSRVDIKAYFEKHFGLQLSVRPPHEKEVLAGVPTLAVNAQILLGQSKFSVFSKKEAAEYNRRVKKGE